MLLNGYLLLRLYDIILRMWPFDHQRKQSKSAKLAKRLVTGLIIGGAIGSVIGKKLLEKHEEELEDDIVQEDGNTED